MPDLEGWVDKLYIRIYDPELLNEINIGYKTEEYISGHAIIGSSDLGDALVIDKRTGQLFWVPFVPLNIDHKQAAFDSIDVLKQMAETKMIVNDPSKDSNYGLEVHYKHPVVFGGDMWDKENVLFPTREKPMELCAYWNKVYYRMKKDHG